MRAFRSIMLPGLVTLAGVVAAAGHAAEGVRGMVDYCGPLLSVGHGHGEARVAMGWAIYGTEAQKRGINGAKIARGWSLNERAVQRDIATIRRTARAVESAALDALAQIFCGGVVE